MFFVDIIYLCFDITCAIKFLRNLSKTLVLYLNLQMNLGLS